MHGINQILIMGNHDNGSPHMVDGTEQIHNFLRGIRIQVTGRFVRNKEKRLIGQCPGDSHSLLFAAGQLTRVCLIFRRKTYQAQHLGNRLADGPGWNTDHSLGKSHIFKYRPVL